ncbi:MAG: ADP-ribosylglycohydrolase family protein, partial [Bacillota bacterium]|nr:ADP-ribosylglycohydrolase family protein [Bacillota bacterium]
LKQLRKHAEEEIYRQKLADLETLLETRDAEEIAATLGNGIEAFNSVPAAICCALRHPDSFEDAVIEAVSLGGDADTIACMTGAIAGARLGIEAIPKEWLDKLENKNHFEKLANNFGTH